MAAVNSFKAMVLRPAIPRAPRIQPILVAVAPFSTTAGLAAGPAKVKSRQDIAKPVKKRFNKKKIVENVKKPNPGERKAFRKRIVLSNNSALAVEGHKTLEADALVGEQNVGTMVELPDEMVDQLRTLGAFHPTQSWGLFRKPHFLVRKDTVDLFNRINASVSKKEAAKIVLLGGAASGKTVTLLQAMSHGLANGWVVINIPEAQDLVIGHTDYAPVPGKEPPQFTQPTYTLNLLQNILKANKAVLDKLKVEDKANLTAGLAEGASLSEMIANTREPDAAWQCFTALWSELMRPGRPPVLMALDGLSFANKDSAYRDAAYNKVHAHNLTLLGHYFAALSGTAKMPNGGAVIAADSTSSRVKPHPSQELVLEQLEAGQAGREVPGPDPYQRGYDNKVYDGLKNSHVLRLDGVSKDEVRALMGYWCASGLVRSTLSAELVAQKWALAGHGNIGELERTVLQTLKM